MPKATIDLPNGTKIEIDGTVEEIAQLTAMYQGARPVEPRPKAAVQTRTDTSELIETADIAQITALIRDCDDAEAIERAILDDSSVLHRVMLPMFIVQRDVNPQLGLTSGEITRILDQLGVKVAIQNVSNTLSGRAKSYVTGDSVRKKGAAVHYRLNRRGIQYLESIIHPK